MMACSQREANRLARQAQKEHRQAARHEAKSDRLEARAVNAALHGNFGKAMRLNNRANHQAAVAQAKDNKAHFHSAQSATLHNNPYHHYPHGCNYPAQSAAFAAGVAVGAAASKPPAPAYPVGQQPPPPPYNPYAPPQPQPPQNPGYQPPPPPPAYNPYPGYPH